MKPVMQTKFGYPDGNCFAACIASIFEIDLSHVPVFNMTSNEWMTQIKNWCALRGLGWMQMTLPKNDDRVELPPGAYMVAVGPGGRGLQHCVVWHDGRIVHDPHPDGTGIELPPDHYDVFFVLDPSKVLAGTAEACE